MRVTSRRLALADLAALQAHIAADDAHAARRVAQTIVTAAQRLAHLPRIGRPGRVAGTRELIVTRTPYIVPYRIVADEVQILRVYHAARRWPARL